ncbi:hypothetical protein PVAG01_01140 [Phlyctema vagabunda]|uniref:Uncharacterized protein n=1 Tax=Phlyctema vagabunda TaxID=108571 RepID=A0ABR4PWJ9_9HELO
MTPDHPGKASQAEFDVIQNRIALALAKRESLVKSWNTSSTQASDSTKTEEELEAEDILHFRREPANLGVGALIPSHFLVSEAQQNNKSLRAKFFPLKGLRASKARDADEKAISAKRAKRDDSSDDEGGRSSLGKAKKQKTGRHTVVVVQEAGTKLKQKSHTELNNFVPPNQGGPTNIKAEMEDIKAEMRRLKGSSTEDFGDHSRSATVIGTGSGPTSQGPEETSSSTHNEELGTASLSFDAKNNSGNLQNNIRGEAPNGSKDASRKKKKRNKRKEQRAAK